MKKIMARRKPIKLAKAKFRIHIKTVGCNVHTEDYFRPKFMELSKPEIRKYFRDVIKYFNNTLRPNDIPRIFIKVEQEFEIRYKNKTVNKYIKI